jgi:hypothetical protein
MSIADETMDEVRTNETRAAGDESLHWRAGCGQPINDKASCRAQCFGGAGTDRNVATRNRSPG